MSELLTGVYIYDAPKKEETPLHQEPVSFVVDPSQKFEPAVGSLDDLTVVSSIIKKWPLEERQTFIDEKGEFYYYLRSDADGNPVLDEDGDEVLGRHYINTYEKKDSAPAR